MYLVIMAGGSGTRLWPMSTRSRPKQFQALLSERTLLQETYQRIRPVAEPEEVFVATTDDLVPLCLEQLPDVPAENILIEPVGRNTGPAIGYVAAFFAHTEPEAVVATVHADHVIGRPDRFVEALRLGHDTIAEQPDRLMTIGLTPTSPHTGFGYIESVPGPGPVLDVAQFKEKPSAEVAAEYLATGRFLWNAGYFIFQAGNLLARIAAYSPALHQGLLRIQAALGGPHAGQVLQDEYPGFDKVPIDTLVFEPESRAGRVKVIPAELEWDDLGSWQTIRDQLQRRTGLALVTRGEVVAVDTTDCLVIAGSDRLVATVGLDGLVVVDTPDALLVCRADQAQQVQQVLATLAADDPRR